MVVQIAALFHRLISVVLLAFCPIHPTHTSHQVSLTVKSEDMEEFNQLLPSTSPPTQPVASSSQPTHQCCVMCTPPLHQPFTHSPSTFSNDKEHLVQLDSLVLPSRFLQQLYDVDFENLLAVLAHVCGHAVHALTMTTPASSLMHVLGSASGTFGWS